MNPSDAIGRAEHEIGANGNVRIYDRPPRLPGWAVALILVLGVIAAAVTVYWLVT